MDISCILDQTNVLWVLVVNLNITLNIKVHLKLRLYSPCNHFVLA